MLDWFFSKQVVTEATIRLLDIACKCDFILWTKIVVAVQLATCSMVASLLLLTLFNRKRKRK